MGMGISSPTSGRVLSRVRLWRSAALSIPSSGVWTDIAWDAETEDAAGSHAAGAAAVVVPARARWARAWGKVGLAAGTGEILVRVAQGVAGKEMAKGTQTPSGNNSHQVYGSFPVTPGASLTLQVYQTIGAGLVVTVGDESLTALTLEFSR